METKYRLWNIINPPNKPQYFYVNKPEEALPYAQAMAEAQLRNSFVISNAFGLEEFDTEDNEWYEWYNEDGEDFGEVWDHWLEDLKAKPES